MCDPGMSTNQTDFDGIFFQTGRLQNEFIEVQNPIGGGAYGIVTRARHRVDDKEYAIKKIRIKNLKDSEDTIRERQVWAKLDCDYFVQYRSSWVELADQRTLSQFMQFDQFRSQASTLPADQLESGPEPFAILHIQMDLCSITLESALKQLKALFEIKGKQLLPEIGYYIASELLLEILTSIKYLHEFNPPVMHRDIKPTNILIKKRRHGKFVKIADFGVAVEHLDDQSHTILRGTMRYMAPEVMTDSRYDTKADVYSIGVMTQELFNFDINVRQELSGKYGKITEITGKAMNGQRKFRPTCAEWLGLKSEWAMDYNEVKDQIRSRIDLNRNYDINTEFVNCFLQTKYKFNENIN